MGPFPVFAFSNSVTQHLSCRQREPTAMAQCLLYSYLLFPTFQNQKNSTPRIPIWTQGNVNLGNKFSSRSWDKYSFIFTYRRRGEKVRILAKVNWFSVLKSTALMAIPSHCLNTSPSGLLNTLRSFHLTWASWISGRWIINLEVEDVSGKGSYDGSNNKPQMW